MHRALHQRRGSARRIAAAGCAGLLAAFGLMLHTGSSTQGTRLVDVVSAATPCNHPLGLGCPTPTPTPPPHTATPPPHTATPPPSHSATPAPSQSQTQTQSQTPFPPYSPPPPYFFPSPPPIDTSTPRAGAPTAPPGLGVQTIVLTPGSYAAIVPGANVLVQITCEAKRGADTYSIPHAAVTLSVTGTGAAVSPEKGDSGDTGAFQAIVTTSTKAGEDTVLTATTGSATAQLTLHSAATAAAGAGSSAGSARPTAATAASGGGDDHSTRAVLIAIGAATVLSVLGVLAVRFDFWIPRRSPWGRRSV